MARVSDTQRSARLAIRAFGSSSHVQLVIRLILLCGLLALSVGATWQHPMKRSECAGVGIVVATPDRCADFETALASWNLPEELSSALTCLLEASSRDAKEQCLADASRGPPRTG